MGVASRRHPSRTGPPWPALGYVLAVVGDGLLLRVAPGTLAVAATVMLVSVLANQALLHGRLQEELGVVEPASDPTHEVAGALLLVPVMSLLARAAPIPGPAPVAVAVIGAVTLVAVALVARPAPARSVVEVLHADRGQAAIAATGIPAGLALALAFDLPALARDAGGLVLVLSGVALFVFVGFVGELVFRVALQTSIAHALGNRGIVAASAVNAAFGTSLGSWTYGLVSGLTGALFGWCYDRTGSILGTSIAAGTMHVLLFVVAPALR